MTYTAWTLKNDAVRDNLITHLRGLPLASQTVKILQKDHTTPQEHYFHMLCDILDKETGNKRGYHKMRYKFQIMPLETVTTPNGVPFLYPETSRNANREEYGQMIDLALIDFDILKLKPPISSVFGLEGK